MDHLDVLASSRKNFVNWLDKIAIVIFSLTNSYFVTKFSCAKIAMGLSC